jgi:hypothetical protein
MRKDTHMEYRLRNIYTDKIAYVFDSPDDLIKFICRGEVEEGFDLSAYRVEKFIPTIWHWVELAEFSLKFEITE